MFFWRWKTLVPESRKISCFESLTGSTEWRKVDPAIPEARVWGCR